MKETLTDFVKSVLNPHSMNFMIVGSMALKEAGFDVEPHDIDLEIVCDTKQEEVFKTLCESQNNNFHSIESYNSDCERRMDKVTWTHKPYIFKWRGTEINVWAVKEFSHDNFFVEAQHHYKVASPVSVLKKKMAYQRPKDFKFLNDFVSQILKLGQSWTKN